MIKNPVMFVVETVAALTTVIFVRDLATGRRKPRAFTLPDHSVLWFTVLFANFAEAVAEAAARRRRVAAEDPHRESAKLLTRSDKTFRLVSGTSLKVGDIVLVEAGDNIPSDGEVIEGVASVNEAAITRPNPRP